MTSLRPWLAAALLVSARASAAEPGPPAPLPPTGPPAYVPPQAAPPPNTERHWYGAQTLIADGLSVGLFVLGAKAESTSTMVIGATGIVLASPFIHWSHGKVATGFGSLALRVIPPIVGALLLFDGIGSSDAKEPRNSTESAIGSVILIAWIPTAVTVDAAALAYEERPVETAQTRWMPSFTLVRGGATVGASGTF
jgi:hypothetical protein